ncbi:MAG: uroporphyrinogen-III synthase [Streptosporangiales bacterium]|nr:uroporphyrinogen-III synthase [Streptosporangiales bacterium]
MTPPCGGSARREECRCDGRRTSPASALPDPPARRRRGGGGQVSLDRLVGADRDRSGCDLGPLAGFTVAVTAERRREELAALLERRGARVVCAPVMRTAPLPDDAPLLAATRACLAEPLDIAVATTGIGFRSWMEAAEGWGLGEQLAARLASATLLTRGPKARGAVRAAGLTDAWSPASESSAEILDHLLARDIRGRRIAVQLNGEPLAEFVRALRDAGAEVIAVPVYRWALPEDVAAAQRLVGQVMARQVDAVTFTSAPAAVGLLLVSAHLGKKEALLDALRGDVVAACVGPVTAGPLTRYDVPTLQPSRARLAALVRTIVDHLPRRGRAVRVAGRLLEVRGHAVVIDGELTPLAPAPMGVLRALARRPGYVVPRAELLQSLPGRGVDGHALEMAVARLRAGLGDARLVRTVTKRGYRLACEPARRP